MAGPVITLPNAKSNVQALAEALSSVSTGFFGGIQQREAEQRKQKADLGKLVLKNQLEQASKGGLETSTEAYIAALSTGNAEAIAIAANNLNAAMEATGVVTAAKAKAGVIGKEAGAQEVAESKTTREALTAGVVAKERAKGTAAGQVEAAGAIRKTARERATGAAEGAVLGDANTMDLILDKINKTTAANIQAQVENKDKLAEVSGAKAAATTSASILAKAKNLDVAAVNARTLASAETAGDLQARLANIDTVLDSQRLQGELKNELKTSFNDAQKRGFKSLDDLSKWENEEIQRAHALSVSLNDDAPLIELQERINLIRQAHFWPEIEFIYEGGKDQGIFGGDTAPTFPRIIVKGTTFLPPDPSSLGDEWEVE